MSVESREQRYMNEMANLIRVLEVSSISTSEYDAVSDRQKIPEETMGRLDNAIKQSIDEGLKIIVEQRKEIERSTDIIRFVHAFQLITWMDDHISYDYTTRQGIVSLSHLLPLSSNEPATIGAMNENYQKTGIWINPKYSVIHGVAGFDNNIREHALFNRDAFRGMNSRLHNCCYFRWDEKTRINNIVIPCDREELFRNGNLKIAYSPLIADLNPLLLKDVDINDNGILLRGKNITGLTDAKKVYQQFIASWKRSCFEGAHIFFGPEMLGTRETYEALDDYLECIVDLSKKAMKHNLTPPMLTITPSRWENGSNATRLVYQDGHILGTQKKNVRFVNSTEHYVEALTLEPEREYVIIHLPGMYRIAVLLCAEFLSQEDDNPLDIICQELGANLIIVPSFSSGEQDFINAIPSMKPFGTSVIWGNCCGAVKYSPRIIGGCAIAGTDYVGRMGDVCQCGHTCAKNRGCLFTINLPIKPRMDKPNSMRIEAAIQHILYPMKDE